MRSFLTINKKPICKWSHIPKGVMFKGVVPEGYDLGIIPDDDYIIVDVDRHGDKDGFDSIPWNIMKELEETFNYKTKNNGKHYWLKYTGIERLPNKTSGLGIDLRCRGIGYVVWYPERDIEDCLDEVNETSSAMNKWIETAFCYIKK